MTIIRYIGIFLLILGFSLLNERNQRKKGKETWESKHNINIPWWVPVLLLIVGINSIVASSLYANISTASSSKTETQEVDNAQQDNDKYTKTNEADEIIETESESETETESEMEIENVVSDEIEVGYGNTYVVGEDIPAGTYTIQAGEGDMYATIYGNEEEDYQTMYCIVTGYDITEDNELTDGDSVTLIDGEELIVASEDATVVLIKQ